MNKLFAKFKKEFEKVKGDMDDETSKKFSDVFEDIEKAEDEREIDKIEEEKAENVEEKDKKAEEVKEESEEIGKEVNEEKKEEEKMETVDEEPKEKAETFDIEKLDEIVSKLVEKHLEKKLDVGLKPMGGKVVDFTGAVGEFR